MPILLLLDICHYLHLRSHACIPGTNAAKGQHGVTLLYVVHVTRFLDFVGHILPSPCNARVMHNGSCMPQAWSHPPHLRSPHQR